MGKITGDASYYSLLDTEWAATQKGLFDPKTGLFWRDSSYVNGTVYWSRGNGWVMGGIVRVLQYLPTTDPSYSSYVTLLNSMATGVVPYLQSDGTWHSDLTHPTKYANPEVSGTGLITYALAYGMTKDCLIRLPISPWWPQLGRGSRVVSMHRAWLATFRRREARLRQPPPPRPTTTALAPLFSPRARSTTW